ncbi:MAG TPA: ATP-binding protein [Candidatus Nitrosopolaris sp.]|nr:ATP-binding protein [Candidatus Nitrosopolaris sp.]
MTTELRVHPSFFREFATKTWVSPNEIVKELIENAFDEDATISVVTIMKDGSVVIEDNAGMDQDSMQKFLLLGSPHKKHDRISPRLNRVRTGRYGTGRLSFLTSFESMKIRTKRHKFEKTIVIDGNTLDKLFSGNAVLDEIHESSLSRNGTELTLKGSKTVIDALRLIKEIRKLAILRQPMFEVYIKEAEKFVEWDFSGAQQIIAPEIQGHRIMVNLEDGRITGELVIARRPLTEDEKGVAIMVGNHIVTRGNFGFDTKLSRVTGFVRCDTLTSRFADKSAIIEDEEYAKFNQTMRAFIIETVFPSLTEYEDVLITREESKIYREIDKVLGQAIVENLETQQEVEGYEIIDVNENVPMAEGESSAALFATISSEKNTASFVSKEAQSPGSNKIESPLLSETTMTQSRQIQQPASHQGSPSATDKTNLNLSQPGRLVAVNTPFTMGVTKQIKKPILKRTFALKKVGYKVIPYEDEFDSRYSFKNENVVFVNKANSTYKAESTRGEEFLLRHIISIVAEALAETKHPEGKDALELQNRLVAEAIRIHDRALTRK